MNTPNTSVYFELMQDLARAIRFTGDPVLETNQDIKGVIPTLMIFNEHKLNAYYTAVRDSVSYILNVRDTIQHNGSRDPNYSISKDEIIMCEKACNEQIRRIRGQFQFINNMFGDSSLNGEPPVIGKLQELPNNLLRKLDFDADMTSVHERPSA